MTPDLPSRPVIESRGHIGYQGSMTFATSGLDVEWERFDDRAFAGNAVLAIDKAGGVASPLPESVEHHRNALSRARIRLIHDLHMNVGLGRIPRITAVREVLTFVDPLARRHSY